MTDDYESAISLILPSLLKVAKAYSDCMMAFRKDPSDFQEKEVAELRQVWLDSIVDFGLDQTSVDSFMNPPMATEEFSDYRLLESKVLRVMTKELERMYTELLIEMQSEGRMRENRERNRKLGI